MLQITMTKTTKKTPKMRQVSQITAFATPVYITPVATGVEEEKDFKDATGKPDYLLHLLHQLT